MSARLTRSDQPAAGGGGHSGAPKTPVYLDYSATAPVDPRVAQKMSRCLLTDGDFGNPASTSHVYG
ncbi:MAG: hypothetical protein OXS50_10955, partial [Gammaproteobacteria bacterium]|nr:hypothetical protein [Gammaproteobacteria bacterium]